MCTWMEEYLQQIIGLLYFVHELVHRDLLAHELSTENSDLDYQTISESLLSALEVVNSLKQIEDGESIELMHVMYMHLYAIELQQNNICIVLNL